MSEHHVIFTYREEVQILPWVPSILADRLRCYRLPELQDELQRLIQETESALQQLPAPPSPNAVAELLLLISNFVQDVTRRLEGTPEADGLLQSIRPAHQKFMQAVRATAPNFRAIKADEISNMDSENVLAVQTFLANEECEPFDDTSSHPIYIDEVMERAQE